MSWDNLVDKGLTYTTTEANHGLFVLWGYKNMSEGKTLVDNSFMIYTLGRQEQDISSSRSEKLLQRYLEPNTSPDMRFYKTRSKRRKNTGSCLLKYMDFLDWLLEQIKIEPVYRFFEGQSMGVGDANNWLSVFLSESGDIDGLFVSLTTCYPNDTQAKDFVDPFDLTTLPAGYTLEKHILQADLNTKKTDNCFKVATIFIRGDGDINQANLKLVADPLDSILTTNYNTKVQAEIRQLVDLIVSDNFIGKLSLIHGPAGTGKSFLVKSLLRELRDIFTPYIVLNPMAFFQSGAYYKLAESAADDERMLFVFEDADKLFSPGVRDMHPDEFSALANLTSGIVGSGRDDSFLFTFNRDLKDIDAAYTRECRCMANIFVDVLDDATVKAFSKKHGILSLTAPCSLADAYAKLLDSQKIGKKQQTKTIGFGL